MHPIITTRFWSYKATNLIAHLTNLKRVFRHIQLLQDSSFHFSTPHNNNFYFYIWFPHYLAPPFPTFFFQVFLNTSLHTNIHSSYNNANHLAQNLPCVQGLEHSFPILGTQEAENVSPRFLVRVPAAATTTTARAGATYQEGARIALFDGSIVSFVQQSS